MLRRNLIIGAAAVGAAVTGTMLRPHREVRLLKSGKLADIVPMAFGNWTSQDTGDPLAVNGPGTLSAKLYNELVARVYVNPVTGRLVTTLLAYGGRQTDDLQLHRPEVCYPAFGFALLRNEKAMLPLAQNVAVPSHRLFAEAESQSESIVYWSRMGETFPQSGGDQRKARLEIAMQGIIPDGLLSRFSAPGGNPQTDWPLIEGFVRELVLAIAPDQRKILIGSERASALRAIPAQLT